MGRRALGGGDGRDAHAGAPDGGGQHGHPEWKEESGRARGRPLRAANENAGVCLRTLRRSVEGNIRHEMMSRTVSEAHYGESRYSRVYDLVV